MRITKQKIFFTSILISFASIAGSDPAWVKDTSSYPIGGEITLKKADGSPLTVSLNQGLNKRVNQGRTPNIMVVNSNEDLDIAEQADFAFLTDGGTQVSLYVSGLLVTLSKDVFDNRYNFDTYTTSTSTDFYVNQAPEQYTNVYNMQYRTGYYDPDIFSNIYFGFRYLASNFHSLNFCERLVSTSGSCPQWDFDSGTIYNNPANTYIEIPKTSKGESIFQAPSALFSFVYRDSFQAKVNASNYRPYQEEIIAYCEHELWGPDGRISFDDYKDHVYRTSGVFYPNATAYGTDWSPDNFNHYNVEWPTNRNSSHGYGDYLAGCNKGNSGYYRAGNGVYYIVNSVQSRPIKDKSNSQTGRPFSYDVGSLHYGKFYPSMFHTENFTEINRKYIYKNGELIILSEGPVMFGFNYLAANNPTKPLVATTKDVTQGTGDVVYILDSDKNKWTNAGYLEYGFDGVWYENMKRIKP